MSPTPRDQQGIRIASNLGARLGQLFSLKASPRTLEELADFSRERLLDRLRNPQMSAWFEDVASGKEVFGEVAYKTRQTVRVRNGHEAYAACALDAIVEGFFQPVEIVSKCFHCDQEVQLRMSQGVVLHAHPSSVVMWLGVRAGTSGRGPASECDCETDACPFINFSASKRHAAEWKVKNPNGLGMVLTLQQTLNLARKGWWEPVQLMAAKANAAGPESKLVTLDVKR